MKLVRTTLEFDRWLKRLRDSTTISKIQVRIDRLEEGNPGDHRYLGGDLSEMRINYGPGYRVYWTERNNVVILLLCGGDKSTQKTDIARARAMIEEL